MLHTHTPSRRRPRIGLLGMVHETNTFAPGLTPYAAFAQPADREPIQHGEDMLRGLGEASVLKGAVATLQQAGADLVPLYRAVAAPSATVGSDAWQRLLTEALTAVKAAGPIDGLLLELHGAMVSEDTTDCEGTLLRALRDTLGPTCVVVATLDFHANVSADMVRCTHRLVPFRTYPHVDMRDTGAQAASALLDLLARQGTEPAGRAWSACCFLVPLVSQHTGAGPMHTFMQQCETVAREWGVHVAFCAGFPMADTPDTGPSIAVYAQTPGPDGTALADKVLAELLHRFDQLRSDFASTALDVGSAMRQLAVPVPGLTVLADVADNPGAGCPANDLTLLKALHQHRIAHSLVATLNHPHWALCAHRVGVGGTFHSSIPDHDGSQALRVLSLSDGHYSCVGPMWAGRQVSQGPTARLAWGNVELIVASCPVQALDIGALTCTGAHPQNYRVLALKSSVHFRAAFAPLAQRVINVDTTLQPGQPQTLPRYRHLRPGVALSPSLPPAL